jgi:hypothetical protein
MRVHVGVFFDQSGTIRMDEVVRHVLGVDTSTVPMPIITRQSVLLNINGTFVDPMDVTQLVTPTHHKGGTRRA